MSIDISYLNDISGDQIWHWELFLLTNNDKESFKKSLAFNEAKQSTAPVTNKQRVNKNICVTWNAVSCLIAKQLSRQTPTKKLFL